MEIRICPICKKDFIPPKTIKPNRAKCCSKKCAVHLSVVNSGKIYREEGSLVKYKDSTGKYRQTIVVRNHPAGPDVIYARYLMEKKIGRYLKPGEQVHHINGNCIDDRIENLQLLASKADHAKVHHTDQYLNFYDNNTILEMLYEVCGISKILTMPLDEYSFKPKYGQTTIKVRSANGYYEKALQRVASKLQGSRQEVQVSSDFEGKSYEGRPIFAGENI